MSNNFRIFGSVLNTTFSDRAFIAETESVRCSSVRHEISSAVDEFPISNFNLKMALLQSRTVISKYVNYNKAVKLILDTLGWV